MATYRLTLAYDGTGLAGWQRQANGPSVQALVEDALSLLDGRPVAVAGAGRTDAGVHALGQVVSFTLERDLEPATLGRALNFHLPPAVRVVEAAVAADDFHARFRAREKTYRYQIWNGPAVPPGLRTQVWHVPPPSLDVGAMSAASDALVGTRDFAAFQSAGTEVASTERTVSSVRVGEWAPDDIPILRGLDPSAGRLVWVEVRGDGFLRHMVRSIVGSLVEIGHGRRDAEWLRRAVASRDRAQAGRTAPAEGLCLVGVTY